MANILIAWELGAGFGHLLRYRPLITHLENGGHHVYFAARDLANAEIAFQNEHITLLQSPSLLKKDGAIVEKPYSYAHILNNMGFNDPYGLAGRIRAWRSLYDFIKPDLVIFDHCPTGMVAATQYGFEKLLCGNGFTVPPRTQPFPALLKKDEKTEVLLAFEQQLLDNVNQALRTTGGDTLQSLQDFLVTRRDLLQTWPELDCYGPRDDADYTGPVYPDGYGDPVNWSVGKQARVFGYLKDTTGVEPLLDAIRKENIRAVIYLPEAQEAELQRLSVGKVKLVKKPVRLPESIRQCRFAINNANLATVAISLQSGIPLLLMPHTLEQYLNTRCVEKLGAGIALSRYNPDNIAGKLHSLLNDDSYSDNAKHFAKQYQHVRQNQAADRIIETVNNML